MKNKQVKQMMVSVADKMYSVNGLKTIKTHGWHSFDESGLFHCSGSNFLWLYDGEVISISSDGQPIKYD